MDHQQPQPARGASAVPDTSSRPRVLFVGAVGNGVFGAAAMWLAERQLGLDAFAPLAQLWTLWSLVATGLVFGMQQWEIGRHGGAADAPRSRVPRRVVALVVVAAAVLLAVTAALRTQLFGTGSWWWPLAAASLPLGTAGTGLAYGLLARRRRYGALASLMVAENGLRLAATVVLGLVGATAAPYALTVLVGFLVALVPLWRPSRADAPSGSLGASVAALVGIGFATSFTVFGGPLLLGAAGGGAAVVSALFLVLIPVRVPFLLANSSLPGAMVAATERAVMGRADELRRTQGRLAAASAALAVVGALVGAAVVDPVAELVFGAGGVISPAAYGLIGAAAALCLGATFTNVVAIALDHVGATLAAWGGAAAVGVVLTATGVLASPMWLGGWMMCTGGAVVATHALVVRRAAVGT